MGARRVINDLTYRLYDRMRHREAFRASSGPEATAGDLSGLRGHKYAVLVTYRRDGTPVPTPVWFGLDGEGRMYVHTEKRTAKVRRIRNDPRVRVFPSDMRGKPRGPAADGTARILEGGDGARGAEAAIGANYGVERRLYERALMHGQANVYIEIEPARRT